MAKQVINIGTTANDGTGDTIRAAFDKANDNFTEVYTDVLSLTPVNKETLDPADFSRSVIVGSAEVPMTGTINLAGDISGAIAGNWVKIYHQDETEPTFDYGGFALSNAIIGEYLETTPATLNEIILFHDGNGNITQTYRRAVGLQTAAQTFYDNTDSGLATTNVQAAIDEVVAEMVTPESTTTFTNKTIDANGTGNVISNLDVDNLASGVLDTDLSSVAATDTTIPSAKATKSALDLKAIKTQSFALSIQIETVADKDYTFILKSPIAGTITEVVTKSLSGTATATVKVNTTALGGTANSVSSAEQSQAHSTTNTFAVGDDIIVTMSANSTCLMAAITVSGTYTLA